MTLYSQRDKRWKDIALGTKGTIGDFGCTITSLGMILDVPPDVVNERLKAVNGYADGNLVIWAKIEEAFPGIKVKRVWTYDNEDVKKNVPNVLVEVDGKPIGGYRHWLVYVGNKKANDPWTGTEVPTSQYPSPLSYCVIGGKWNKPSPVQDTVAVDKATFENLVRKSTITDKIRAKLNVEDSETIILAELDKLITYQDAVGEKDRQLETSNKKIADLELRLEEINKVNEVLAEENQKDKKKLEEQAKTIDDQKLDIKNLTEDIKQIKENLKLPTFTGFKLSIIKLLAKLP